MKDANDLNGLVGNLSVKNYMATRGEFMITNPDFTAFSAH